MDYWYRDEERERNYWYGDEEDPESSHPPLSPATGVESLFLAGLRTSAISANALAFQLQKNRLLGSSGSEHSSFDALTNDFASAVENFDDFADYDDDITPRSTSIPEYNSSDDELEDIFTTENSMAKSKSKSTMVAPTTQVAPTPMPPKEPLKVAPAATAAPVSSDEKHVDAAAHVYEGIKGAWGWGKGVPVVSTFLGISEHVAGKVVGVAGTNLEEIDGQVKPKLKDLDNGVFNPAIEAVVGIVLGAGHKAEDIIKPILFKILTPFGLIKNEAENPEMTTK